MRVVFNSQLRYPGVAVLVLLSLGPIGFLFGGVAPVSAATSTSFSFAQAGDYGYHPETIAKSNGTLANPQGGSILKFIQSCPWAPSLGTEVGSYGFQYYFDYPAANPFAR